MEAEANGVSRWNPWHGCRKTSPGCLNCYVYRIDAAVGRDPTVVVCTAVFVKDGRTYRIPRRDQLAQAAKAGIDWP